jgi:hypothetical protein
MLMISLPPGCLAAVAWLTLLPLPATAVPLLSEVFYDAVGSDNGLSFVEIHGTPGASVAGWTLEGVNGADGSIGPVVALDGVVPADGLFVVADESTVGATLVPNADLVRNFDFQNGPDSIVLRSGDLVLDAVGYGVFQPGEVFAGEGAPAEDGAVGTSLARRFANVDTGNNAADFSVLAIPTPGVADFAPVPEPATAGLLLGGLAGLAAAGRWRRDPSAAAFADRERR